MLAVTQLEVYVLARGRWTLHARYAGEDNKEALWDAQATERSTGYPAKIVRETFFPELNDSERITTYISPKAKKAGKAGPAGPVARPQVPLQSRARQQTAAPRLNAAQMMLRVLVAAAFSVVAAAVMAFVIKYVLQSFADIGISISPAATSMIMTYSWVAMFLLFFFSLFRSRLPLHRLLADMWHASARPAAAVAAKVKPVKLKLKPKHDRGATSPETLKAWQDLRMRRGDPDIFSSPDDLVPDLPLSDGTLTQFPVTKPAAKAPDAAPEKSLEDKAAQDKAAQDKAIQDRIAKAKEKSSKEKVAAEKAVQVEAAAAKAAADKTALGQKTQDAVPLPPTLREEDDYAHTALQRFIADVIKPAAAASMRDDPVARRGIALAVAGAIDGIAARPEARGLDTRALLAWGLRVAGLSDGAAALFLESHDALSRDPVNSSLVASGQGLMTDMIPLQTPNTANFVRALADALAVWRTPFGSVSHARTEQQGALPPTLEPARDAQPQEPGAPEEPEEHETYSDLSVPGTPANNSGLRDVFMLTELRPLSRHNDAVQDDARMAGHNDRIRAALSIGGGQEIKHTGKGIFARFADPATALATAKDLQRDLGRSIALALIGNADAAEDPVLSPTLFLRAEAAMGSTGDGQVSVEAHVIGEHQRLGQPTDLVILAAPPAAAAETAVA